MKFLKDHAWVRMLLIALFFIVGLVLTVAGWRMTGQLVGLGIMFLGIISLLTALLVYNSGYKK